MQGLALRNPAINQPEEPQPFLVPMPRQAGGEEGALGCQQGNLGAEYESHRRLPAASPLRQLLAFGRYQLQGRGDAHGQVLLRVRSTPVRHKK